MSFSLLPRRTQPIVKRVLWLLLPAAILSLEVSGVTSTSMGLQFNGSSQYVTFGAAPGLGAATFTLETWFKRTGAGVGTSTGSGGIASAIPLVTKGRAEAEGSNVDMNYFMGIDAASGKLVADFEEGPSTGGTLGLNHPVTGNTGVSANVWHHAAATYDGQTWKLYLDGVQDGTLTLSAARPPRSDSVQHAALATAMTSGGAAAGFFQGVLDEARIWNVARSAAQIAAGRDTEITSAPNLIGRWSMNEGSGTTVADSSGTGNNGTAMNAPSWVTGFPFPDTTPPAVLQNVTASAGNGMITVGWNPDTETDLAGYNVYRSDTQPVPTTGTPLNGATPFATPTYTDRNLTNFTTYYYAVVAVDTSANASAPSVEVSATPDLAAGAALQFDGTNDFVTFGQAPGLGTPTFTLETWFKRTGAGVGTTTGSGGIASAIPLVTKGRAEAENSNVDMNYFLGIDAASGVLVADFEEGAAGSSPGLNHAVSGTISIPISNTWHHAAATYDGQTWKLYLDGSLDRTLTLGTATPPRSDSIQHAALGTALNSTGVAAGFFQGLLDEARIWNFARSQAQIQGTMQQEVTSGVGLLGRWSLNEGSGTLVADSTFGGVNGTVTNGAAWVAGYLFSPNTNSPPVADAGSDQTITFPSVVTLSGTVTDDSLPNPPGTVSSLWSKVSGPGTVAFANASSPATTATFSSGGVYLLRLTASDSLLATNDDVVITVNQAPAVNAGIDQTITLPATASLSGVVTDDGLPNPPAAVTTAWSQVSGSGTVTFSNSNDTSTSASFSAAGTYVLRLTANDSLAVNSDDVTIVVNSQANLPPVVNAGSDQAITLPAEASLSGTVTDDGLPSATLTSTWSKVSGPGTVTFGNANATSTTAGFSAAGIYVLRLTGADGALASSDDLTITVNPVPGNYALDFGGTDAYVTFGAASDLGLPAFTLEAKFRRDGAGIGANTGTGGIASALPLVTKGRAQAENSNVDMNYFLGIDTATNTLAADFEEANTGVSGNTPGLNHPVHGVTVLQTGVWYHAAATYDGTTWRLYLNGSLEAELAVRQAPRSDSIQHAAIGSALNSTGVADGFFNGVIDDVRVWDHARTQAEIRTALNQELTGGTGLVASWNLNAGIGTLVVDTTANPVNGSITGANWSWVTGAPAINLAPAVDAGTDQTVVLPANAALTGVVTDDSLPNPPGVVTTSWSQVSGPGTVTFGNNNAVSTSASFSSAGTYVLRLTATDGLLAASDDVTVAVSAPVNQAPVVNAGVDQAVTLPAEASLTGTVSDDGLPTATLTSAWSKVSGPGTVTFGNVNASSTTASFSTAGAYVLRLTASDGQLAASDDISITVSPVAGNYALDFGGTNAYVTFGAAPALGLPAFTLEAKFRRDGAGIGTNTGTAGIASALPLVTKGRAEAENSTVDMNYFLGIDTATNTLAADFEEANTGLSGNTPGLNHPVHGVTVLQNGAWYHAAATYDGTTWRLYLNGSLEAQLTVGQPPRSDSTQHAAIGSAQDSTGIASGFFDGAIDEVRVWDHARTAAEIGAGVNQAIATATGLVARWALDEGVGTSVANSTPTAALGSIVGTNWSWVAGAPVVNVPPVVDAGPDQAIALSANATLRGVVTDDGLPNPPASTTLAWSKVSGPGTVTFGSPSTAATSATFSVVGTYVLALTANDAASTTVDQVTITVTGNQAPAVSAGSDQSITLPAEAFLNGSASDDGLPAPPALVIGWSKVSGPGTVTFDEATSPTTTVSFSAAGVYVLRLTANDGALTTSDDVTITVNAVGSGTNQALGLSGTDAYVTFGNPAKLHLSTFTIETWFNRQGTGVGTNTGSGGLATALPLVTRGMAETETTATDMNYFLGIDLSTNTLAADFEEGAGGATPGLNHPVMGVTPITSNTWHHAAATYDGTKWQLFLDGVLERELIVGQPVAAAGDQHAALGTALNSTGGVGTQTRGLFNGLIDEARIWNRALTAAEIASNANVEILSANGLVARWGLNEGAGTSVGDSAPSPAAGTIIGSGSTWTAGAPFSISHAPGTPVLISPGNDSAGVPTSPSLAVSVSDADAGNLTVTYYGRPKTTTTAGPDFTLIALPDTQFYSSSLNGGSPAIFNAQTQWIVNSLASRNIVFVTQLGDCVQNGDNGGNPIEWLNADSAMSKLEDPVSTFLAQGIPFGIAVGNHDQSPTGDATGTTNFYNQYFGSGRFTGRAYYGGHYGSNNDNHFELFSASGLDFIVVHLEYDPAANPAVLSWANSLLQTYGDRRAIVVSHYIINAGNPGSFGTQGQAIYNALKGNPNLFLMLSGHVSPPEGQRQDTFNGHTVTTLMSDYQSRTNGGNGWLRIMEFSPANNQIRVKTYSPTLDQFETDADSQFTLSYDMQGGAAAPFAVIGTNTGVAPGSTTTTNWANLTSNTEYEWYVTVSDGTTTTTGPIWSFTTTAVVANHSPVANGASATTAEDTAKAITLTASDADNDPLTYAVVSQPTHGTLTGVAPNVSYMPTADYSGPDSFTFKANDGNVDSNIATVTLTVTAVNDAPVANPQSVTTAEDTARAITLTASDPDGGTLSYSIVAAPTHGTLSGAAPNVTYTPAGNYNGADSFSFRASDGTLTNTAIISVTVTAVNDPPVAVNQAVVTASNTSKAITLTANDPDGGALTFNLVSQPAHGTLSGTAPNVTYTPAAGYTGADAFTFNANDGTVDGNTATVSISVTVPPVAQNQSISTPEDTAKSITLTSTNPNGGTLTFAVVTAPTHGTLSGTAPNVTYAPAADYNGADSFTFTANDGTTTTGSATISISVTAVNDAPVATDGGYSTPRNRAISGSLVSTDVDSATVTFAIVTQPRKGTVTLSNATTGAFTYVPGSNATGSDSFTFKANDGSADSNVATVSIKFTPAASNTAPTVTNGTLTTAEDVPTSGTLLGSDADGNPLTYRIISNGTKGTVTIANASTGAYSYLPAANANGTDSFTFRANDGLADSNLGTVSVTISAVNDAPVAGDDTAAVAFNTAKTILVLANDVDPEQDVLSVVAVTQAPAHGTAAATDSTITYVPFSGSVGADSFKYTARDSTGAVSNEATVTVNVGASNQPPVAIAQSLTTAEDIPVAVVLGGSDPEGNQLIFSIVTGPTHGTLSGAAPNLTYSPASNYNGQDSFTFKVNDGSADSNPATVTLMVNPVNDAPVAIGATLNVTRGAATPGTVTASDAENSPLTFAIGASPKRGTISGFNSSTGEFTYTPKFGARGNDTFTFTANDGTATSAPATITVVIR